MNLIQLQIVWCVGYNGCGIKPFKDEVEIDDDEIDRLCDLIGDHLPKITYEHVGSSIEAIQEDQLDPEDIDVPDAMVDAMVKKAQELVGDTYQIVDTLDVNYTDS